MADVRAVYPTGATTTELSCCIHQGIEEAYRYLGFGIMLFSLTRFREGAYRAKTHLA